MRKIDGFPGQSFFSDFASVFFVVCVFCCSMLKAYLVTTLVQLWVCMKNFHLFKSFCQKVTSGMNPLSTFHWAGKIPSYICYYQFYKSIRINYFRSHEIRIPIDHRNFHCFHVTGGEFSRCWFQLFLGSLTPKIGEMILTDVLSRGASHQLYQLDLRIQGTQSKSVNCRLYRTVFLLLVRFFQCCSYRFYMSVSQDWFSRKSCPMAQLANKNQVNQTPGSKMFQINVMVNGRS